MPRLAQECIASWKKCCPDYEIREWNEENSPISEFPFAQQALEQGKWAFVSDVIRLYALYTYGGIYLDTDVELLKPLDPLLETPNFCGYERDELKLQTAVMAAEKGNPWVNDCLKRYQSLAFSSDREKMAGMVNNLLLTNLLKEKGVQFDNSYYSDDYITLYPSDYFCPMSYGTHFIENTENTYCIHYYSFSWSEPEDMMG